MTLKFRASFALFLLVLFSLLLSLAKGSLSFSLYQLLFHQNTEINAIFFKLRLARTVNAFVSGGLLALAGSLMQLLLKNPLADPYVLGISGGAAFFTLLAMLCGLSGYLLTGSAWLGSLLTVAFILLLARKHQWQTHTLLLVGIALACAFSAGISLLLLLSPERSLHAMLFWLTGDLNGTQFSIFPSLVLFIGIGICVILAPGFNLMGRGEYHAKALGLAYKPYMLILFLLSSLFTATAVTQAGCIGFVGLIVPHFARYFMGYHHRYNLPFSLLLGGSLLTLADTFARTLIAPEQLPVGIIMVLLGVPVFIWLLQHDLHSSH